MNAQFVIVAIFLALIAGVTIWFLWKKKKQKEADSWKKSAFDRANDIKEYATPISTPMGQQVYFERGTNPAVFSLEACDVGRRKAFEKISCAPITSGPVDPTRHVSSSIYVFQSEIAPESGIPCYRIFIGPGSYYYNSEWDMQRGNGQEVDHYILAAGQMIGADFQLGDSICVPHYTGREVELARIVEYENEHIMLAYYWGDEYQRTKEHGSGTGHPLLPDCVPSLAARGGEYMTAGGLNTGDEVSCVVLVK